MKIKLLAVMLSFVLLAVALVAPAHAQYYDKSSYYTEPQAGYSAGGYYSRAPTYPTNYPMYSAVSGYGPLAYYPYGLYGAPSIITSPQASYSYSVCCTHYPYAYPYYTYYSSYSIPGVSFSASYYSYGSYFSIDISNTQSAFDNPPDDDFHAQPFTTGGRAVPFRSNVIDSSATSSFSAHTSSGQPAGASVKAGWY